MSRFIGMVVLFGVAVLGNVTPAMADEIAVSGINLRSVGAALAIGLAVLGGAMAQGKVVSSMIETYGRNPSVGGKLLVPMLIGLALMESLVILAFVIAYQALQN